MATTKPRGGYRTLNPATGELLRDYPSVDDVELERQLETAHQAYLSWRDVPIAERVALFSKVADIIEAELPDLAHQVSLEMGKIVPFSLGEGSGAVRMFRYYAEHGPELLADEVVEVPGFSRVVVRRDPVGVVLGVEPWNAPLFQAMRATAPNLMLGNTVLLKPAEICAGSTLMFDQIFREAGFPEGCYQTLLATTDQVSSLIADDRVRAVTLTGSDRAGSAVGEQASRNIKPVVLELGGSDAFIVLDSADVDAAATTASTCRLLLGGQACALPKRVIVTDGIAEEFTEKYVAAFSEQVVGDPFDDKTTVGPMSSQEAADLLQEQLDDAVAHGATVLLEGGKVDGPGAFFRPTVITDVTPQMRVYREEPFGPLGMVFRVADAEAAIALANDNPYGLGGAVFGEPDEAMRIARALDTGGVGINGFLGSPVEIPFGGTKRSGVGRELGRTGMDQFANIKTYAVNG
ncbi:aldehyde dehydrogenase family protein [Aeromicrobium sp. YIM 150415]|uniref:aldehyde dehydrogenase family protein n=1 Tax=Aeromicrobium sp. YIM 150415 TaxID=2803912 RepID=UPI001964AB75|nr:aldehyde dehydrogenase family protein [Aeromicrobium sp. YIM 150415]MBM9464085.1 aldehyde dehydrogenase family protein [Aeromicrobium sp. YIM 150415]